MPTLTVTLPRRHAGQQTIVAEARRYNILACGRRFGKTTLGIDRCVTPDVLRYPVGWFSPTYKMLLEVWREAVRTFAPITARRSSQERRIEFITGGLLEFWSLDNPDVARGRKYRRVVIDEAAMVPNLMDAWQYAIRPTLADYNGDAWFLSTPKGRNGFWQMWQWGHDGDHADWQAWQMPSNVNPRLAQSEIDAMRDTMPESVYRQEIEAAFIDNGGSVFRNIAACLTAPLDASPDVHKGHHLILGADWARESDFTCFSVGCVTCHQEVARDRFNQVDYHVQTQRLQSLAERWHVADCTFDTFGDQAIDIDGGAAGTYEHLFVDNGRSRRSRPWPRTGRGQGRPGPRRSRP